MIIFNVEFVIVGKLFSSCNSSIGENDDTEIAIYFNGFRHTVWIARVIYVTRQAATQCSVYDALFVQAEHVNTSIGRLVALLAAFGQFCTDHFTDILDDHSVLFDIPSGIKS